MSEPVYSSICTGDALLNYRLRPPLPRGAKRVKKGIMTKIVRRLLVLFVRYGIEIKLGKFMS